MIVGNAIAILSSGPLSAEGCREMLCTWAEGDECHQDTTGQPLSLTTVVLSFYLIINVSLHVFIMVVLYLTAYRSY